MLIYLVTIYQSGKNPDRLLKVGNKIEVDKWLPIFIEYPKYFPRVYRYGIMKDGVNRYVEVEKLNTKRVIEEWDIIDEYLDDTCDTSIMGIFRRQMHNIDVIRNKVAEKSEKVAKLLMDWVDFLEVIRHLLAENKLYADVHAGNFGYDKAGNKKCLDF